MRARDNPFAVQRVLAVRYRLAGVTWEELLARLAGLGFRAALVGPHGHGKTTLLEDLGERLAGEGFRTRSATLHEGERRLGPRRSAALFRDPHPRDLLLVDGAEQLDRLAWWHLRQRSRSAVGLIVTSHLPGLLPTLHECRTTPELLGSIVTELGGADLLPSSAGLFARHGGNLRDALRELYDRCARLGMEQAHLKTSQGPAQILWAPMGPEQALLDPQQGHPGPGAGPCGSGTGPGGFTPHPGGPGSRPPGRIQKLVGPGPGATGP